MLPIVTIPNPILKTVAKKVSAEEVLSATFTQLITDLTETMYGDDGIGIAAPQVGVSLAVCIIGKDAIPDKKADMVLINPVVERISRITQTDTEGCLSIPKVYGEVKRPRDIRVHAMNMQGQNILFDAHGFFARVIQHETDHLNGILFVERAKKIYKMEGKDSQPLHPEDIRL